MSPARVLKATLKSFFETLPPQVFRRTDLAEMLEEHRGSWGLSPRITVRHLIDAMSDHSSFQRVELAFPLRTENLFKWGDVSPYALALIRRPHAYLSHQSAAYLRGISEAPQVTIYVNQEQSPKPVKNTALTQEGIDAAMARPPRVSSNVAEYDGYKVMLLSGKHTGRLGVEEATQQNGETLQVSGIERTLIDIAVRPAYGGGVSEVLDMYRRAFGKFSVSSLAKMLRTLDYTYPYHQVIGFYLERSGCTQSELEPLRRLPREFDFYAAHALEDPVYIRDWRLFVPRELSVGS